ESIGVLKDTPHKSRIVLMLVVLGDRSRELILLFFFSGRRRHTRCLSDWSSDVCSSDLEYRHHHVCVPVQAEHGRPADGAAAVERSEERRVGKECRSRRSRDQETKKPTTRIMS